MLSRYIKPFLPRGLYSRVALIVLLPVITTLLVLSIVFIQRHYEGVTRQMTDNFVPVVRDIVARVDAAGSVAGGAAERQQTAAQIARALAIGVNADAPAPALRIDTSTSFFDISSRLAIRELELVLPDMVGLRLRGSDVSLWLPGQTATVRLDFPLSRISARNPHQLLVVVFAIGMVMSLISFLYLKNQIRPIRQLARAAEAFGRGQILPLGIAGATEVRAASAAFLEMRARIERHIEQRTLLLSGVSHDLRTPLTRMRLALSMLESEPEAAALLDDVAQMEALIDRFLDFTRDESVEPAAPTDLGVLVAQRVAEAACGGKELVAQGLEGGPVIMLRPQLFARALDNLIANALRYGIRARVSIDMSGAEVIVTVEDDGPGIDPAQYGLAVRPFVRLDPARGASSGSGVGLGLAIVNDAMRAHGGRLELGHSTAPGYGGLRARLVVALNAPD